MVTITCAQVEALRPCHEFFDTGWTARTWEAQGWPADAPLTTVARWAATHLGTADARWLLRHTLPTPVCDVASREVLARLVSRGLDPDGVVSRVLALYERRTAGDEPTVSEWRAEAGAKAGAEVEAKAKAAARAAARAAAEVEPPAAWATAETLAWAAEAEATTEVESAQVPWVTAWASAQESQLAVLLAALEAADKGTD